jgi:hypothetical protein
MPWSRHDGPSFEEFFAARQRAFCRWLPSSAPGVGDAARECQYQPVFFRI